MKPGQSGLPHRLLVVAGMLAVACAGRVDVGSTPPAATAPYHPAGPTTSTTTTQQATTPAPPMQVTALAGNGQALVAWLSPSNDGGSPITGFAVSASPGGAQVTVGIATSATVSGLLNGTSYTFTVSAQNAVGMGAPSLPSNTIVPLNVPNAPTDVVAAPGNGGATVTWTPPTSGATVVSYTVVSQPAGQSVTTGTPSATLSGLANGSSCSFTVIANGAEGSSSPSAPSNSIVPASPPFAPTGLSVVVGNGQATLSWAAPAWNGGSPVLSYTATSSPGGLTATSMTTTAIVTGLSDGVSYSFTVHATNAVGSGPESASSSPVVPQGVPGAPTNVVAVAGNAQATITWAAPGGEGFSAIGSYTVVAMPGGATASTSAAMTTTTMTGLTNGTSYTFTVAATNVIGVGLSSASSNAVTPATIPGAPTQVTATPGDGQASVAWLAPVSNGGASITGYVVTVAPSGAVIQTSVVTTTVVTGLSDGTAYTFAVQAMNSAGTGASSTSSVAITPEPAQNEPGPPTQVEATLSGVSSATVSWLAPANNGGLPLTAFSVTPIAGSVAGASVSVDATLLQTTLNDLQKGTVYTFQVNAQNAASNSVVASSNSVTTPDVPGVPSGVMATRGDGQASVTWLAPTNSGGSPVISFTVTPSPSGPALVTVGASATGATVTGLVDGTAYTFTVHATNAVGSSAESPASGTIVPAGLPDAPVSVTAASAGSGTLQISWIAPASTGGLQVLRYTATASPGGQTVSTNNGTTTSATMGGLTNGTSYTFTVHATNAVGDGPESAPSAPVTPAAAPGAPTNVMATAGDSVATVSWSPPANTGGAAIISYTVTPSPSGSPVTVEGATTATVTGLLDGTTYSFSVYATNSAGNGPASTASNAVVPITTPGPPLFSTATAGVGQATLSWYPPASDGGSALTGYSVAVYQGATLANTISVGATTTQTVVTGLSSSESYSFQVSAVNAAGAGPAGLSNAVTMPGLPEAPAELFLIEVNGQIIASWAAPLSNNGSPITSYTVSITPGTVQQVPAGTFSMTFPGVTSGTSYNVSVFATNAVGNGPSESTAGVAGMLPSSLTAVPDAGVEIDAGGSDWDGGYQPVTVSSAVAKVKNLLVGLPPTDTEVATVTASNPALSGLVDQWVQLPQYTSKMQNFFATAFEQSEINTADFADEFSGQFPFSNSGAILENFQQSFARTAVYMIQNSIPFNQTMTTQQYMMTPALMAAYAFIDAYNQNDSSATEDWYSAASPTQTMVIESTTPIALTDSLNPMSMNYLTFYNPNIAKQYDPLCPYGTITYKAPLALSIMTYVMANGMPSFTVSPNSHTCSPPAPPAANQIVQASDYTTWQWVTVQQPMQGQATTRFFDLVSMRAADPLVLKLPRVGFFTTPAFLAGWNTNTSNQARVTLNQTMITSLGEAIDLTNTTAPPSLAAVDQSHAAPGSTCYGCHQSLDPMRQFFRQDYSLNYGTQMLSTETALPGQFAFHGVSVAGTSLYTLGAQLAAHPMFAAAWAQKLCTWANSAPCDPNDPAFLAIVADFVNSNYSWATLVHDLFSSPLVTYLQDTPTVDTQGETFAIARQAQFCALLSNRLGITDICGLDVNTVVPTLLKPVQTIAAVIPSDAYSRGNATPVLANDPSPFLRTGLENLCAAVAADVIDSGTTPLYSSKTATSQNAAIQAFVTTLMGLTDDRSATPLSILQGHFAAAMQTGATASQSLQSTFVLACLSPYVIGVGQ